MKPHRILAGGLCLVLALCLMGPAALGEVPQGTTQAIEDMLQQAAGDAGTPCVAAAWREGESTGAHFIDQGGWKGGLGEESLFEIGSVSKSFTGFGILLLEARGMLSLEEAVTVHIPWLRLAYAGQEAAQDITVGDLLYQTSGFTNDERNYPAARPGMGLEENVCQLDGKELAFAPGERFNYANANYNLLGYIIEQVTGLRYAHFMRQEVFVPLGMEDTYADPAEGMATGRFVTGSRRGFGRAFPYEEAPLAGAVPAGFLLSCAKDMARWAEVHLGRADLPAEYAAVAERSHQPGTQLAGGSPLAYAAGWFVDAQEGLLYHAGGTNGFSSYLAMEPESGRAVCVLTNQNASANTADMALNTLALLAGRDEMVRSLDVWTVVDTIFTALTAVSAALLVLVAVRMVLRRRRVRQKPARPRSRGWLVLPGACVLLLAAVLVVFPLAFASDWPGLLEWGPLSLPWGLLAFGAFTLLLFVDTVLAMRKSTSA